MQRKLTAPPQRQQQQVAPAAAAAKEDDFVEVTSSDEKKQVAPLVRSAFSSMRLGGKNGGGVARIRMVYITALTSDGSGTCYGAADVHATVQLDPDWSNLVSVFDQYRVTRLGVDVCFYSTSKVDQVAASTNGGPRFMVVAYDSTDAAVPSSETTVYSIGTSHVCNMSDPRPRRLRWAVASPNPLVWLSTSSNTNPLIPASSIKWACDGTLGTTVSLGKLYFAFDVEFRMRK